MESKKVKHEVLLPNESYIGNRFTYNSHCTIGGLYKVYYFKMDEMMIEYLYNKGDLIKFNSFNEIYFLEDPCFYKGDRVMCSICSHEQTFALFLQDNELENFRLFEIPFTNKTVLKKNCCIIMRNSDLKMKEYHNQPMVEQFGMICA